MILSQILRAGDQVVMKMDKEARYWGRQGPVDGTRGTVLRRLRSTQYKSRYGIDRYFYVPGVYEEDTAPEIQWEDGRISSGHSDIEWADEKLGEQRYNDLWVNPVHVQKKDRTEWENHLNNTVRISDLPDAKFFELDIVRYVGAHDFGNDLNMRIRAVNWYDVADERGRSYSVEWINADGSDARCGMTYLYDCDLELVERGNVWREYSNIPLIFNSLLEEVSFAKETGRAKEVRNPANNMYSWTKEEVLRAIKEGIADGFSLSNGFFGGSEIHHNVYHFDDRDLGERVRQETMRGFGII